MTELQEMKDRVQKDYKFSQGELGVPVTMCIDTYNGGLIGAIHDGYTRAYDRKSGLLGVICTDRFPLLFTPTFLLNSQRVEYVKEITGHDELRLGRFIFLTLDDLRKAPGFDGKHMELIEAYRAQGASQLMCRVVYTENSYGAHITVRMV